MTIINIIFFALIFRICGGGIIQLPRWIVLLVSGLVVAVQTDLWHGIALVWLFFVIRILPTQALFTATHGKPPRRKDGRWNFLQIIAAYIAALFHRITNGRVNNYLFGIIYGTLRASLALPAMIYLGNYWLLAHGLIYYLAGRINQRHAVTIAELVSGAIFGAGI